MNGNHPAHRRLHSTPHGMKIGLFIQIEDPHMWLVINGINDAARKHDATVIIYANPSANDHNKLTEWQAKEHFRFDEKNHDGLILAFGSTGAVSYAQELRQRGFPVFLLGREAAGVPCCRNNTRQVVCNAVHSMVEKGHTQIAFIAGPEDNPSSLEKFKGYEIGLQECELPFDPNLVIAGDYTESTAWWNVSKTLKDETPFTALIASNDLGAIGAMQALQDAKLCPGADVEVIGYDNIPRSRWTKPALSTHDPHYYKMGYRTCEELIHCIEGAAFCERIEIEATPVPRSTTWESNVVDEQDHPMTGELAENRFLYECQLAIIRADAHASELLERIQGLLDSPESFIQAFKELLSEVTRHGVSAGALYPIVDDARARAATPAAIHAAKTAVSLQTAILFEEQKRRTETAMRFNLAIYGLRALSVSVASETMVYATLWNTLQAIDIGRAGIYILDTACGLDGPQSVQGTWLWLDRLDPECAGGFRESHLDCFDAGVQIGSYSLGSWIFLPIRSDRESFGFAILNADTEYSLHLPDLVRQFSTALCAARMQAALTKANAELVETSRMAGLAEMATGVLHNIGNALNSVNTSCTLLGDQLRKSRMSGVSKAVSLLKENEAKLGSFFSEDPKGKQVLGYLQQLGEHLTTEQRSFVQQVSELQGMIDHINQIVAAQQNYAQVSDIVESIESEALVDFSLKMAEASITRHNITVSREFEPCAKIRVSRQKTIQILVNLLRNAKEAMDEANPPQKLLNVRIEPAGQSRVAISVRDNGTGISPDTLSRIFNFGYTTKAKGHGFGLHNAALAAKEMGGALSASSEGPGKGACFRLELPACDHP